VAKTAKPIQRRARAAAEACCPPRPGGAGRLDTQQYAKLLKALSDPTRLEIVGLLASARGELCVCHIEAQFRLSQPTVSHHLRLLREAGLVTWERRGTWVYYALRRDAADKVGILQEWLRS
jgi:ArsR family transcriptional regulator